MAWRRQQPGEMHWSKDFVEHLRTVHFALIVTCVALIVIKTSGTESTYQKARNQIELVKKLAPEMNATAFADKAEKAYIAANSRNASTYVTSYHRGSETFRASMSVSDVFLVAEAPWRGSKPPETHPGYPVETMKWANTSIPYQMSSLQDFKTTWDAISKHYLLGGCNGITAPELVQNHDIDKLFVEDGPPDKTKAADAYLTCSPENEEDYAVEEELGARRPQSTGDSDPLLVLADTGHSVIVGLLDQEYVPFFPQDALRATFPDLPQGKFSEAFADLNELTNGLQSDKIDELQAWLSNQQSQHSSESFEAFGVRFPASATVGWGTVVVLAVQIYLLLHLRELAPRLTSDDPGLEVPWVGLYRWSLSRLMMIASLLLPAFTIFVLNADSHHWFRAYGLAHWKTQLAPIGSIILSLYLTWQIGKKLLDLQDMLEEVAQKPQ
jgi:hypothetical protein